VNFISKYSIKLFLGLLLAVILFHICIILKIIPYDIAWGGRLTNDAEMYVFETTSILINIFLSIILLMKDNIIKYKFSDKIIKIILWTFFVIFVLNTIGNIFAKTTFEKFFSILTGISAVLIWIIVNKKNTTNTL
jgi:hypothetical protein